MATCLIYYVLLVMLLQGLILYFFPLEKSDSVITICLYAGRAQVCILVLLMILKLVTIRTEATTCGDEDMGVIIDPADGTAKKRSLTKIL